MANLCNGVGEGWVKRGKRYFCSVCNRSSAIIGGNPPLGPVPVHNSGR